MNLLFKSILEMRFLNITIILFFSYSNLQATDSLLKKVDKITEGASITEILIEDIKGVGEDYSNILKYSFSPTYKHIAYPLAIADITLIASGLDETFRVCPCKKQDIWALRQMGEISTAVALPISIYLSGLIFEDKEIRITGRLLFESLLLSSAVNTGMKIIFGRSRPFMEMGNYNFQFFELSDNYQSFPSGHTCAAFTIATLLAGSIDNNWVDTGLYLLAAGTGIHRILADKHWFSDVIIGGSIGLFSSNLVLKAYNDTQNKNKNNMENNSLQWSLLPSYGLYGVGISLVMQW